MLKVAGGGGGTTGGVVYQGTWNANTNDPALASGIGTKGNYYVVSVSGNTNLDGITDWVAGDWAIFNGVVWQKVDNTESVISVNGQTGVVVLTAANVNAVADTAIITAGTGLSGGGTLASNTTISLANTAVTPGTYGSNNTVAVVTIDAQGRVNSASNVAIAFPTSLGNITVDSIDFNTAANISVTESLLTWDANKGTLVFGVDGGLPLSIGTENLVRVYNNTGTTITKGQVVSITGGQGQTPTVGLSNASSEALSRDTLGIAQENIPDADTGFVCTFGIVTSINTYGTTAGEPIYLSNVAGQFTSTQPQAPDNIVSLGWIVRVSNTPSSTDGQIFVTINNGWELDELHNVRITNVAANQYLVYNGTSNLWVNQTAANVVAGTGLTGGGAVIANTNVSVALANTAVTPGTYGGATQSPQIVIDAQGRITSASNVTVAGSGVLVTNLVTITAGSEIGWTNNSSTLLAWTNNSSNVIAWLNNTYLVTANNATILANSTVEPLFVQLPNASTVSGQQFVVKKIDSSGNQVTITTTSSQKIDNANTYALSSQYMAAGVQSDNANYWVISEVA